MIAIGAKVVCRGQDATEFSLDGTVESIIPEKPTGAYAYGVRLVNGNYKLFPADNVREVSS